MNPDTRSRSATRCSASQKAVFISRAGRAKPRLELERALVSKIGLTAEKAEKRAAVQAELIVTLNLRDFPESALAPLGVQAKHPDSFLISLYDLSPQIVTHSLHAQAAAIGRSTSELLKTLERVTPDLAELVRSQLHL